MINQGGISSSGPYGGLPPPRPVAGMAFYPFGYLASAGGMSIAANTLYYVPFPIFRTTTFAGARFLDSGTGNNTMHVRMGLYAESASGGPGALLKDFGAATLTATAGTHLLASAVTVSGPQMCYVALLSDNTPSLKTMFNFSSESDVGFITPPLLPGLLGDLTSTMTATTVAPQALTVSLAYGALPATAPTPTGTVMGATNPIPAMQLYL